MSGNNNNGTIYGATWGTESPDSSALIIPEENHSLSFNSVGDFVEIQPIDAYNNLDDFSFSIWLKLDKESVENNLGDDDLTHFIINKDHHPTPSNGTWSFQYYRELETDNRYIAWGVDSDGSGSEPGAGVKTELANVLDDQWHYYAGQGMPQPVK